MIPFSFTESFKALDRWIRDYNQDKERWSERLRQPHKHCLQELLKMYAAHCHQEREREAVIIRPFRFNHSALSDRLHISTRTAQRYTSRLEASGMIEKTFHGSNTSVTLQFKAPILQQFPHISQISKASEGQPVTATATTSCQHIDSGNLINKSKEKVDKSAGMVRTLIEQDNQADSSGSIDSGQDTPTGSQQDTRKAKNRAKKDPYWGVGSGPDLTEGKEPGRGAQLGYAAPILATLYALVAELWDFAEAAFYTRLSYPLTDGQKRYGIQALMAELMEAPPDQWKLKAWQLKARMIVVEEFINRKPGRYVPIPTKYFDPDNPHGWKGAEKWVENHRDKSDLFEAQRIEFQNRIAVYRAVRQSMKSYIQNPYDPEIFRQVMQRVGKVSPTIRDNMLKIIAEGQIMKKAV